MGTRPLGTIVKPGPPNFDSETALRRANPDAVTTDQATLEAVRSRRVGRGEEGWRKYRARTTARDLTIACDGEDSYRPK